MYIYFCEQKTPEQKKNEFNNKFDCSFVYFTPLSNSYHDFKQSERYPL